MPSRDLEDGGGGSGDAGAGEEGGGDVSVFGAGVSCDFVL